MTAKTKRKPKAKAKVRTNNITIHIDDQAFKTAAPKAVVERLKAHAREQLTSSVGQRPSWADKEPTPALRPAPPMSEPTPSGDLCLKEPGELRDYWDQAAVKIEFQPWLRSRPWLRWWYVWRFRRSLAKASMGSGLQAGWRRRCLNAVRTGKITGILGQERGLTDHETTVVVSRAIARRVLPAVHFWRKITGGWLDNVA